MIGCHLPIGFQCPLDNNLYIVYFGLIFDPLSDLLNCSLARDKVIPTRQGLVCNRGTDSAQVERVVAATFTGALLSLAFTGLPQAWLLGRALCNPATFNNFTASPVRSLFLALAQLFCFSRLGKRLHRLRWLFNRLYTLSQASEASLRRPASGGAKHFGQCFDKRGFRLFQGPWFTCSIG